MRDKLIELIKSGTGINHNGKCDICQTADCIGCLADYLMAHGVTVQEWIPVEEELPETILCTAGTVYSNAVNALTSGRKVITAIWDGENFIGDAAFWDAEDEVITHWTPVLLPLPEAPEEVEWQTECRNIF